MQIELEETANTIFLQLPGSYSNEENSKCCFSCTCTLLSDDYFPTVAIFILYFYVKDMSDMVKHELRVTSYELQVASYELRVESLKAQVESLKARVEIQKCELPELRVEIHELRV